VEWSAFSVPAGTPAEVIGRLRATARKAAADPAVQQSINLADSPIMHLEYARVPDLLGRQCGSDD
jgi:tripartite-type tricarboxylate transporter receptor subunit TctC